MSEKKTRKKSGRVSRTLNSMVRWINEPIQRKRFPTAPTGRLSEVITTEHQILEELKKLNETMAKFERCISSNNHQKKPCVLTAHWNDGN